LAGAGAVIGAILVGAGAILVGAGVVIGVLPGAGAGAILAMAGAIQVMVGAIPVTVGAILTMVMEGIHTTVAEEVITAILILML